MGLWVSACLGDLTKQHARQLVCSVQYALCAARQEQVQSRTDQRQPQSCTRTMPSSDELSRWRLLSTQCSRVMRPRGPVSVITSSGPVCEGGGQEAWEAGTAIFSLPCPVLNAPLRTAKDGRQANKTRPACSPQRTAPPQQPHTSAAGSAQPDWWTQQHRSPSPAHLQHVARVLRDVEHPDRADAVHEGVCGDGCLPLAHAEPAAGTRHGWRRQQRLVRACCARATRAPTAARHTAWHVPRQPQHWPARQQ